MTCAATTTIREAREEDLRFEIAAILRDWIHETPLSLCGAGADTCPDWKLAFEVRDLIWPPVAAAVAAVGPGEEPAQ